MIYFPLDPTILNTLQSYQQEFLIMLSKRPNGCIEGLIKEEIPYFGIGNMTPARLIIALAKMGLQITKTEGYNGSYLYKLAKLGAITTKPKPKSLRKRKSRSKKIHNNHPPSLDSLTQSQRTIIQLLLDNSHGLYSYEITNKTKFKSIKERMSAQVYDTLKELGYKLHCIKDGRQLFWKVDKLALCAE
jgi:hypothetical protein